MKFLLAALTALTLTTAANATCSLVEVGTMVQYRDSTGSIHAGQITSPNGSNWNLWYFKSGVLNVAQNVANDQTQGTNNTFFIVSCVQPF